MAGKQPKREPRPGVDEYGRSPLHNTLVPLFEAVDLQAIARLLNEGADPNARDDNGFSPLHFAAQQSLPEAARLLIAAGADPSLKDSFGNTPLARAGNTEPGLQVVRLLLDAGADPFIPNNYGVSAADVASISTAQDPKVAECIRRAAELYREVQRQRAAP